MARAAPLVGQGLRLAGAGLAGHHHRQGATTPGLGWSRSDPASPAKAWPICVVEPRLCPVRNPGQRGGRCGFGGRSLLTATESARAPRGQPEQCSLEHARGHRSQDRLLEDTCLLSLGSARKPFH